ncbi:hypothetical protein A2U01_0076991 [Trifolium medium]|uniref:Uncharacterized protein n=1 Tax=Trifolium medium TaxID=97028 RepID=A0A392T6F7_9FABA|nr:hypothetical protein [Trifolium medium]
MKIGPRVRAWTVAGCRVDTFGEELAISLLIA